MTTGLQTVLATPPSDPAPPGTTPGADRTSLKKVAQAAGLIALAGGGTAFLLSMLLRPKPVYNPTGSARTVRTQSTEDAISLRTQQFVQQQRHADDSARVLRLNPEEKSGADAEQQRPAPEFFVEPGFTDGAPQERQGPGQSREDGAGQRLAPGVGVQGAEESATSLGDAGFGDATAGSPEEETLGQSGQTGAEQGAGEVALEEDLMAPMRSRDAKETDAGDDAIELDAAPPDVSAWLEGPVVRLEELPLLEQQADTLPELPPERAIATAQPAAKDGIYVEDFAVTGNSVFSAEKLAQVARAAVFPADAEAKDKPTGSQVGMVLSPAELVQASDAITEFYTTQGYVNSGAYVPEEVLRGAPPEIRVIEGKLESINVTVKPPNTFGLALPMNEGYVGGRLAQAGSGTLNLNRLVDGVRLLELDPLIESIATELVPGSVTGTSVLNVEVQQAKTFSAGLTLNNYRSPSIGSFTQGLSLQQSNILGRGDTAQLGYSRSSGSNSLDFGYSIPFNAKDGTISLRHSRNSSRVVEDPFSALDAVSKSRLTELRLRQPIIKKPDEELAASLTLSRYFSRANILNDLPLTSSSTNDDGETRISALRFGQEWSKKGKKQFMALQSQFSLGLGGLLGDDVREEGQDSRFLSWRGKGRLVRALGPDTIASLKGEVQLTPGSLAPVERFSVGGPTTVRGYRQNTVLTDGGWLASAEAQVPVLRFPKWKSVVQLAPFVDMGGGWNMSGDQPEQSFLASTGIGAILRVGDDFSARVDYGIPITGRETDGGSLQDSGLSFSINLTPF